MINAFLEAAMKNTLIKITDRKAKKIGFVVYGLSPKIGGKLKSATPGGLKPSSSPASKINLLS
jgi:hypothetical protein